MSGAFSKPKKAKMPKQEKIEEVQKVEDDASDEQDREKKKQLLMGGRQSTMLAGITNALKKRLGE